MDKSRIKIVGIGEGGARAVGKMIAAGIGMGKDIDFIVVGKDENILLMSPTPTNIFLNRDSPTIYKSLSTALRDAKTVIIMAGLGGTAATGAIPRIVSIAKNMNAATVAFANLPFVLESVDRKKNAEYCLNCLRDVDTSFVIPSEKFFLFRLYKKEITTGELFDTANEIFCQGVKIFLGINPENKLGKAAFAYGYGATNLEAIKNAVKFPALEPEEIKHAKKIFVRLTGSNDTQAKSFIREMIRSDAKLFWRVEVSHREKVFASMIFDRREVAK